MKLKLFIGNLSWSASDNDLRKEFGKFGTITELKIITDRETGKSRGFGFVGYSTAQEAETAIREMDGREFMGRSVRVSLAQERARQ